MLRCKALEILRNKAYEVYTSLTRDDGNTAGEYF